MSTQQWEQRRRDSERLWADIRRRIEELDRVLQEDEQGEALSEIWQRRAFDLARASGRDEQRGETLKLVVFRIGTDRYAVKIEAVREIQKVGRVAPVTTAPPFVAGVINLRGVILSVIDLRAFLGLESTPVGDQARIVVAEGAGMVLGLLVEGVQEIADVPADEVKAPLATTKMIAEDSVSGIVTLRGQMVVLIDLERVLGNPRIVVDEAV